MGWYDAFRGDTARVNMNGITGGNAAKNFGDAFSNIGQTLIASDAQSAKNKLLDLQVQDENMKVDNAKKETARIDLNNAFGDLVARTGSKKGLEEEKVMAIDSLLPVGTDGLTQDTRDGVVRDINEYYTAPTREAKEAQDKKYQDQYETSIKNALYTSPDKKTFSDAFAAIKDDTIPLSASMLKEQQAQMQLFDAKAQNNFNTELIKQSTNLPTFEALKQSPDYKTLVGNADSATLEHVIDRYQLGDKQKAELLKNKAEINHYQNSDANAFAQTDLERQRLAETKRNNAVKQDKRGSGTSSGSSAKDDEKDIKSIDVTINGLYGKKDSMGNFEIDKTLAPKAQWLRTRAIAHVANGSSAARALTQAQLDYSKETSKFNPKKTTQNNDPLGLR